MADNARYPRKWTEAEIEEYRNGTKTGFSWWEYDDEGISALHKTITMSIRGGSDRVQYFISGSFMNEGSIYDVEDNFTYDRYTLRGNFTAKLTENLTMDYQTSTQVYNVKESLQCRILWRCCRNAFQLHRLCRSHSWTNHPGKSQPLYLSG
jgi:hypothetical protein